MNDQAISSNNFKPEKYKSLFRLTGNLPCLHSEFFINGSLGLGNTVAISKDRVWHTFIDKKKEKLCLQKGLELFSSKEKYEEYANQFRKYIGFVKKKIIPKFKNIPKLLTKKECIEIFKQIQKFYYFYGITEFSYHDLAYQEMLESNDTILKQNLEDLGQLKIEGRKILNEYMFIGGITDNILRHISLIFFKNEDTVNYLYFKEIISLFDGVKPSKKIIEERKKCYAIAKREDDIIHFSYQEALYLANEFIPFEKKEILKGLVANKAKVKGKVVIAPMLTDAKKVKEVINKMKKGNILVAQSTTPELMVLCNKAAAIVTDQGGMLSHAAIVSRELDIPCIIGTINATRIFKDGDYVEVDTERGTVKKINI